MLTSQHQLLERDGYRCVATGYIDHEHPQVDTLPGPKSFLEGAHILRRSLANFTRNGTEQERKAGRLYGPCRTMLKLCLYSTLQPATRSTPFPTMLSYPLR